MNRLISALLRLSVFQGYSIEHSQYKTQTCRTRIQTAVILQSGSRSLQSGTVLIYKPLKWIAGWLAISGNRNPHAVHATVVPALKLNPLPNTSHLPTFWAALREIFLITGPMPLCRIHLICTTDRFRKANAKFWKRSNRFDGDVPGHMLALDREQLSAVNASHAL